MKSTPNILVEPYRVTTGRGATRSSHGNNGAFRVRRDAVVLNVIVSDGFGWDHLSISLPDRCPTWEEQLHVIDLFACTDETWMALRPPKALHINNHPYCLHWWRPQRAGEAAAIALAWERAGEPLPRQRPVADPIPLPPSWMVGIAPGETVDDFRARVRKEMSQ